MNERRGRITALAAALAALSTFALAQTDSGRNVSGAAPPPELGRFAPFLGQYTAKVDWPQQNLNWDGSLEIASAVKGWYVETNLIKETAGPHRHWRMLIGFERSQKRYRVWRFETTPLRPQIEGEVHFDSDNEWHAVWRDFPVAGGRRVTYYSRFRLKDKDELHIITDTLDAEGKKEDLGIVTCKRKTR